MAEAFVQPQVTRRQRQQIGATHDVGDALVDVIDDNGQMVSVKTIASFQNKIAAFAGQMLVLLALYEIGEAGWRLGDTQSPSSGWVIFKRENGAGRRAAVSRIDALARRTERRMLQTLAATRAGIDTSSVDQRIEYLPVAVAARGLPRHFVVPAEAVSAQRLQDVFGGAGNFTITVNILDAHQPLAADMAGVAVTCQRRQKRAEVQRAGRRRGEASAVKAGKGAGRGVGNSRSGHLRILQEA